MREIKFRAWDKEKKIMREVLSFEIPNDGLNSTYHFYDKIKDKIIVSPLRHKNIKEYAVLMQFTGIKDKKGKEIYEGDILEPREEEEEGVGWCEDYACWSIDTSGNTKLKSKIIGNIYENPELLGHGGTP